MSWSTCKHTSLLLVFLMLMCLCILVILNYNLLHNQGYTQISSRASPGGPASPPAGPQTPKIQRRVSKLPLATALRAFQWPKFGTKIGALKECESESPPTPMEFAVAKAERWAEDDDHKIFGRAWRNMHSRRIW